jgi:hypothetical protein
LGSNEIQWRFWWSLKELNLWIPIESGIQTRMISIEESSGSSSSFSIEPFCT